jgi:hypothetical protein
MDWSKVLISCSSLGSLFTEPKLKADKDAGKLSVTAKKHLIKVYIKEKWGRRKDFVTKHMEKGLLVEPDEIALLNKLEGKWYVKNTERKNNEWITGEADIVDELIIDMKGSWDAETFLPNLFEGFDLTTFAQKSLKDIDTDNFYQMQGYLWLWDKQKGRVSHCLVNTPESLINSEKYRLLRSMDVISEENEQYKIAAAQLEYNMIFDDVPREERVINFNVERDEETITQIPNRVEKAREFLQQFDKLHIKQKLSFNKQITECLPT